MTLPPVARVFFAIDLPQSAKEKLGSFISLLKKKSKSQAIRWTKPENLHITLQFLAEVKTEDIPAMINNVRAKIAGVIDHAPILLGTPHVFPNPYRPRVIVLDVTPQTDLATLSGLIGHGIKITNYDIEDRPFRAHLTLGRIKQPKEVDLSFLAEAGAPQIEKIEVNEVVLFRSDPLPEGSTYSALERITLAS